ncbi:hypothetical protein AJ79_07670 [Helicocarpus griseus UAMH5409]|uniref:Rhodopsin domain-containing protein n=1 Tax=Helicocarpus griseus UAMH5409 TaxID=1447875 RepID=A0A2B7X0G7_9EURO|nr:hypothetical protein AJ79_07670 [Helicocarpus griseus UAMH5409]
MFYVPPEVRATWPPPNYDNPETRGPGLIITVLLFHIIGSAMVFLRWYTRTKITFSFGVDDVWIIFTLIPSTGLAASVLTANINYGWDRHVWDLEADKFRPGMQLAMACYVLFAVAASTTKLSLLAFYRRLVTPISLKNYKWVILVIEILVLISGCAYAFGMPFLCRPIQASWDFVPPLYKPDYEYHCIDRYTVTFPASIGNAILDFLTMLIPVPIAWQLRLPMRQRLAVIGIFCLGGVVVLASCVKTKYVVTAMRSYDEQYDAYPLWIMSIVEIDVGIICASAPALRPLISRYAPKVFGSMSRPRSSRPPMELSLNSIALTDRSRYMSDTGTYKSVTRVEKPRAAKVYTTVSTTEEHPSMHSPRSIQSPITINNTEFVGVAMSTDTPEKDSEDGSISPTSHLRYTPSPTSHSPYWTRSHHSRDTSGSLRSYRDDTRSERRSESTITRSQSRNEPLNGIDEQGVSTWEPLRVPLDQTGRVQRWDDETWNRVMRFQNGGSNQ